MKIGILTFHWATNHGGILQAYALQKYLSEAIPSSEVYIIDYWPARYQKSIKKAVHSRHVSAIINNFKDIKKERILAPFRSKLKRTYRYYSEKQLQDFPPQVDVLITGSDQVWNEFYAMNGEGGVTTAYFLPFQPNAKRISYAASFGFVSIKPEMEAIIKPCLEKFDAISVREQTGKDILDKMGLHSTVVCDPTLLLERNDYTALCQNNISDNYVAKYILRVQSKETRKCISKIERAVSQGKKIVKTELLSIEEWLGAIKDATCLVTNSFHGVVFALKFHTPFFVVCENRNLKGMNDRFYTLLDVVGLKDRIVSDVSQITEKSDTAIDWAAVDEKLHAYAEASKDYLLKNCTKSSIKKIINFYTRAECCGCSACAQNCPKKCIEMVADAEGFLYPKINESQCVRCGKCHDVCHIKHGTMDKKPISDTFYAKNDNDDIRLNSSSGGIFAALAEAVLREQGVIFGAALSNDARYVQHISVHSVQELYRLRGSKYVQSEIGNAYVGAKKHLTNGKKVFSGTPCQVRGLRRFLGQDYPNLITVDLICHGAPSLKTWNAYLDNILKKHPCGISDVSFRSKETGWKNFSMKLVFADGTIQSNSLSEDPYMQTFLNNLSLRPACYACVCKETDGVADITLGDAWGIQHYCKELDDNAGTSVVFARTQKGRTMLEALSADITAVRAEGFNECLKYNSAMCASVAMPSQRAAFFADMNKGVRFDKLMKKHCKTPFMIRIKRFAKKVFRVTK